jgi:hypothetical protein
MAESMKRQAGAPTEFEPKVLEVIKDWLHQVVDK